MADLNLKVSAIDKLLDYTASGIGAVAGPIFQPWEAFWDGKAKRISARVDADVSRIQAESEVGTLPIIAKAQAEAREYLVTPDAEARGAVEITRNDITQRIEYQERKRHTNIKAAVVGAADELGDEEVSDYEPDPDWTARFFDCVQDVSSEDMQKLWARILAGEVESPGRTTLRTLDTLRNMTKRDSEMFKDMCDFVIRNDFVFYNDSIKGYSALSYSNLLHLQDCGLINVGPNLVKEFTWGDGEEILLMYHRGCLVVTRNSGAKEVLKIPDILLTTAGKELSQFVQYTLHMKYLQAFSSFLKSENCQLAYLDGVVPSPDGGLWYANRIPIEPESEQVVGSTP